MVHVVCEQPATTTKPAKVCICLDPSQTVNKAILRQVYPIPTLEENLHCFYQVKIFSTFDIKDAFQTNNLTEESSLLTTVHTPWGHYRWTRLPFGTSSAPEESTPDSPKLMPCLWQIPQECVGRRGITTETKIKDYKAVVLTTLLYGCESWTVYQCHARKLNHFHTTSMRKLLGIKPRSQTQRCSPEPAFPASTPS